MKNLTYSASTSTSLFLSASQLVVAQLCNDGFYATMANRALSELEMRVQDRKLRLDSKAIIVKNDSKTPGQNAVKCVKGDAVASTTADEERMLDSELIDCIITFKKYICDTSIMKSSSFKKRLWSVMYTLQSMNCFYGLDEVQNLLGHTLLRNFVYGPQKEVLPPEK